MRHAFFFCAILAVASPAAAEPFAYATGDDGDFGVLDIGTGAYVHCGYTGTTLFGLAVGPGGALYGMDTGFFYRVHPRTGALTQIAPAGNYRVALGSAAHTIYTIDSIANLYTVDPATGVESPAGKAVPADVFVEVLSAGAQTLYETTTAGLYDYILKQDVSHRKNRETSVVWGGLALVDGALYGVGLPGPGETTQYIYAISTLDGTITAITTLSSAVLRITGLAPTPVGHTGTCKFEST